MSRNHFYKLSVVELTRGPVASAVFISFIYLLVNALLIDKVVDLVKSAANPYYAAFILVATLFGQLLTLFHVFVLVKEIKVTKQIGDELQTLEDEPQEIQINGLLEKLKQFSAQLSVYRLFENLLVDRPRSLGFELPRLREFTSAFEAEILRRSSLPQYIANTLIGLGLFGTFLGLIVTLKEVAGLIGLFSTSGTIDSAEMLGQFFQKMSGPLAGMGDAFVASLFGLGGSIINSLQILAFKKLQNNAVRVAESAFFQTAESVYGPPTTDASGKAGAIDVRLAQLQLDEIAALRLDIAKQTDAILIASSKMRQAAQSMDQTMQVLERVATQEEIRPRFEQLAVVLEQRLDGIVRKLEDSQMVQYSLLNVTKDYADRVGQLGEQSSKLVQQSVLNHKALTTFSANVAEYASMVCTTANESNEALKATFHDDLGVLAAAVAEGVRVNREQNELLADLNGYGKQTILQLNALHDSTQRAMERVQPQVVELIARLEKTEQTSEYVAKYDWGTLHAKVDKLQASVNGAIHRGN